MINMFLAQRQTPSLLLIHTLQIKSEGLINTDDQGFVYMYSLASKLLISIQGQSKRPPGTDFNIAIDQLPVKYHSPPSLLQPCPSSCSVHAEKLLQHLD